MHVERVWDDGEQPAKTLKHEGFFIHHREIQVNASAEKIFHVISQFIKKPHWQVEAVEENEHVIVCVKDQIAGAKWMEWRMSRNVPPTSLTQTIFFAPYGLTGFLCWYLTYPFLVISFHRLIKSIARHSVVE